MSFLSTARKVRQSFFPILLILSSLFIFGPFVIYSGNLEEFDIGYLTLIGQYIFPFVILYIGLLSISIVLSDKHFQRYIALLFGLGIVLWLQGNVFVGSYGFLDGSDIDWTKQQWRIWHEAILWVAIPISTILFSKKFVSTASLASKILISIQAIFLLITYVRDPSAYINSRKEQPPEDIYIFSSETNITHIVLDGFQSDCFLEIMEEYPEYINAFNGFVFFENNMGVFPTTRMSIPAMFSGSAYQNTIPMKNFIDEIMKGKTTPNILFEEGWLVDIMTLGRYRNGKFTNWYPIPKPFVLDDRYNRFIAAEMLDLVLFRYTPHFIKKVIYNNQRWLIQSLPEFNNDRKYAASNATAFFTDYMSRMEVGDALPRYKFLHLNTPHTPMVLDSDCKYIGKVTADRESFKAQATCAIQMVAEFLNKLRSLDIYDRALIIISSDHGSKFPSKKSVSKFVNPYIVSRALALLLVKCPHATQSLIKSTVPTSLTDIPATISEVVGLR